MPVRPGTSVEAELRMNFGAGSITPEGWINVDRVDRPGIHYVGDVRAGLPEEWGDQFEMIVANHVLSDLTHHELVPALKELRRCLAPEGVLRVLVPDLAKAMQAYREERFDWFPLGDDLPTMDERLCTFLPWFGESRSVFTRGYLSALLTTAGFERLAKVGHKVSVLAPMTAITALDDREEQALIMEAVK